MRRLTLVLAALALASGCAPSAAPPEPTPTRFVPSSLLTPRSTPQVAEKSVATALPTLTPGPRPTAPPPTPTPAPTVRGTPVAVSEPLVGLVRDDRLTSAIIGQDFVYRIYLPPEYQSRPQHRYPVLYLLHGNGGNYTEWTDSYLAEQADRLMAAKEIPPFIIVMPDDGEDTVSYWANWSDGPRWGDYVVEEVVSTIDQRYRTLPNPRSRAIGGLSMGGLGALNLAFQHPDIFGVVGGHSPSVRLQPDPTLWFLVGDNFWQHNPVWLAKHAEAIEALAIWLDAGTEDKWLPNISAVRDALVERGLDPTWNNFPGPHEAEYWIEHVPDYLRWYGSQLAF
ncbi:MAG: esterase family protein [Chloroflexota bacterium]|nr:esterase family protein [Chloroflexota bacterium]